MDWTDILNELFKNVPLLLIVFGIGFIFIAAIAQVPRLNIPIDKTARLLLACFGAVMFIMGLISNPSTQIGSLNSKPRDLTSVLPVSSSELYSSGENIFLKGYPDRSDADRNAGAKYFKEKDFKAAASSFENAVVSDIGNPELKIYLKNSKLLQRLETPSVLAAVIPIEGESNRDYAEEFLRGVADSQENCDVPIEILIARDGDSSSRAAEVAKELASSDKKGVLGIIGHFSSSTTETALKFYGSEDEFLPVISPSSTSDSLTSNITPHKVFFRTTPSDSKNGKKLAEYASKIRRVNKIAILYNPDDPYSASLQKAFESEVKHLNASREILQIRLNEPGFDVKESVHRLYEKQIDTIALFPNTTLVPRGLEILNEVNKLVSTGKPPLTLLGGDALYGPALLRDSGVSAVGLVLPVAWFDAGQHGYAKKAYETWKGQVNWVTAMSYDATQAFCRAIYNSDSDFPKQKLQEKRNTLLQALGKVSLGSDRTSGEPLSFSEGEANRDSVLVQVGNKLKDRSIKTPNDLDYGFKLCPERPQA